MSKHTEILKPQWDYFTVEDGKWAVTNSSGRNDICTTTEAGAKIVVKLGNNHDRLVEALKRCVLRIELFSAVPFSDESDFLPPIRELLSELEKDGE